MLAMSTTTPFGGVRVQCMYRSAVVAGAAQHMIRSAVAKASRDHAFSASLLAGSIEPTRNPSADRN